MIGQRSLGSLFLPSLVGYAPANYRARLAAFPSSPKEARDFDSFSGLSRRNVDTVGIHHGH